MVATGTYKLPNHHENGNALTGSIVCFNLHHYIAWTIV